MSRKMQRSISKWLNWKSGAAVLAVLLIAAIVLQFTIGWGNIWGALFGTAGPEGGQTCLPTCAENDGKFLSLVGEDMASFGGEEIVLWITVPGDWGSFEVGFFDGDAGRDNAGNVNVRGGNWDSTTTESTYTLYADPVRNGVGNEQVAVWSSSGMPNNAWFNATVSTGANARTPNGDFAYRLELTRPVEGVGINALKVRSNAWLSTGQADLVDANFSIAAMMVSYGFPSSDLSILYPQFQDWTNMGECNYKGDWEFYFYVPTSTAVLEFWDGDFDRGSVPGAGGGADTDDPNTEGVPVWASSFAQPEGVAGSYLGTPGRGSPPDNCASIIYRRGDPVWYQVVDPNGVPIYKNGEPGNSNEPSGTEEWEHFVLTTDTGKYPVNSVADQSTSQILPGLYRWDIYGLDAYNTVWIRTNETICTPEGCPPPVWCDTECACPRTIGYWKNNFDKILAGKTKGIQESRESLEWGLRNIALVSPLYRHGIDYCNPVPISDPTPMTLEEAHVILMRDKKDYPGCDNKTMLARALQQNLATWMNLGTSKIGYNVVTTLNGIAGGYYEGTMWEALNYAQDIILYQRGDAGLLERAKDIADMINNGELNVDPDDRGCDEYANVIPPDKQPPKHNDLPEQPKHPEEPKPIIGCDTPRTNQYGVENPTNNPFYGIKFEYQSGTEIRDGGFDEFRYTVPTDVADGITSVHLEAKAADIVGDVFLDGCQFNQFIPCDHTVNSNGFTFSFQGAVDNNDGSLTLVFYVWNDNPHGLSHATFGLPDGVVPANPSGGYQSQVCP